ncbi:MAG: hypothetical protein R3C56_25080 [Pirellulaceae bacterium]
MDEPRHHHDAAVDAMQARSGTQIRNLTYIMLGLPGETHDMMMATADQVARWNPAVKIDIQYAVERTELADQVRSGQVRMLELMNTSNFWPTSRTLTTADFFGHRAASRADALPQGLHRPYVVLRKRGRSKPNWSNSLTARGTRQGTRSFPIEKCNESENAK